MFLFLIIVLIGLTVSVISLFNKSAGADRRIEDLERDIKRYKDGKLSEEDLGKGTSYFDEWVESNYKFASGGIDPYDTKSEKEILERGIEFAESGVITVKEIGTTVAEEKVALNELRKLNRKLHIIGDLSNDEYYEIQLLILKVQNFSKNRGVSPLQWCDEHTLHAIRKILEYDSLDLLNGIEQFKKYRSDIDSTIDEYDYLEEWLNQKYTISESSVNITENKIETESFDEFELKQEPRSMLLNYIVYQINSLSYDVLPNNFVKGEDGIIQYSWGETNKLLKPSDEFNKSILQLFQNKPLLKDLIEKSNNSLLGKAYQFYTESFGDNQNKLG